MWTEGLGGGDYRGHEASVPLRQRPQHWGWPTARPALSHHAMPLSISLFDIYLLCCLGQGWGQHSYITGNTGLTRVYPSPSDLSSKIMYTRNTGDYRTTRRTNQRVKCCCWARQWHRTEHYLVTTCTYCAVCSYSAVHDSCSMFILLSATVNGSCWEWWWMNKWTLWVVMDW